MFILTGYNFSIYYYIDSSENKDTIFNKLDTLQKLTADKLSVLEIDEEKLGDLKNNASEFDKECKNIISTTGEVSREEKTVSITESDVTDEDDKYTEETVESSGEIEETTENSGETVETVEDSEETVDNSEDDPFGESELRPDELQSILSQSFDDKNGDDDIFS